MFLALFLLVVWPVAELVAAILVAKAIGVLLMLLLVFLSWPLGRWIVRSRARAHWRTAAANLAAGRPPGGAALDAALITLGGLLLMVPGFISDALGAALLFPFTRLAARTLVLRNLGSRFVQRAARFAHRPIRYDVDGTATDVEPPRLPL